MKLTYLPLESYRQRYTELLSAPDGWAERVFTGRFESTVVLRPETKRVENITSGKVLDRLQRPLWALEQMRMLIQQTALEKVYFDDFFHPGLEALPYARSDFQAYGFCWAQTFDVYDFTRTMTWMRSFEFASFDIYRRVFVACDELKEMIAVVSPGLADHVDVVGLPFDSQDVAQRLDALYECDKYDLVYSSRFDREKNPSMFLNLVERTGVKAAICTGHRELRGDDVNALARAKEMMDQGKLTIHRDLTKGQYYSVLANSHVQFNCALQDWVSFTLLEALTFGCVPLYPNFRAMPSTLMHEEDNLYRPFDVESAASKLMRLLNRSRKFPLANEIVGFHDGTLRRIAELIYRD